MIIGWWQIDKIDDKMKNIVGTSLMIKNRIDGAKPSSSDIEISLWNQNKS